MIKILTKSQISTGIFLKWYTENHPHIMACQEAKFSYKAINPHVLWFLKKFRRYNTSLNCVESRSELMQIEAWVNIVKILYFFRLFLGFTFQTTIFLIFVPRKISVGFQNYGNRLSPQHPLNSNILPKLYNRQNQVSKKCPDLFMTFLVKNFHFFKKNYFPPFSDHQFFWNSALHVYQCEILMALHA